MQYAPARIRAGALFDVADLRQREYGQRAAERRGVAQAGVAADPAKPPGRVGEPCGKADPGPAADTRQHRNVLLAVVAIGHDVADDAGRSLELEQLGYV